MSAIAIILFVVLLVLLIGGLPQWPYNRSYGFGYGPSGIFLLCLIILIILLLTNRI